MTKVAGKELADFLRSAGRSGNARKLRGGDQAAALGRLNGGIRSHTCDATTPGAGRCPSGHAPDLYDGAPQYQSANDRLPIMRTPVSASRSKAPSSSSVGEALVAAERQAIPGPPSSKAVRPTGWQSACRTGRPFR